MSALTVTAAPSGGRWTAWSCRALPGRPPSPGCRRRDEVSDTDVAIVGVPFDTGVSYRPGARFGPSHIRQSSKLLRPYNPAQDVKPFASQQVADAGDIACNPFDIEEAMATSTPER